MLHMNKLLSGLALGLAAILSYSSDAVSQESMQPRRGYNVQALNSLEQKFHQNQLNLQEKLDFLVRAGADINIIRMGALGAGADRAYVLKAAAGSSSNPAVDLTIYAFPSDKGPLRNLKIHDENADGIGTGDKLFYFIRDGENANDVEQVINDGMARGMRRSIGLLYEDSINLLFPFALSKTRKKLTE